MEHVETFKERYAKLKQIVERERQLAYSMSEHYEKIGDTRNRDKEFGEFRAWDDMLDMLYKPEFLEAIYKVLCE